MLLDLSDTRILDIILSYVFVTNNKLQFMSIRMAKNRKRKNPRLTKLAKRYLLVLKEYLLQLEI